MLPITTTLSYAYHLCESCLASVLVEKVYAHFSGRFWSTVRNISVISQWYGLITKGLLIWCPMVGWSKLWKWWESQTTSWTYLKTAKRYGEQSLQHVMKVLGKLILGEGFFRGIFFSSLLFIVVLIPSSIILNKTNLGYVTSRNQKLNHLLFMDDLKPYAKGILEFLDSRRWTLHTSPWMMDSSWWTLDTGLWRLEAGLWRLDSGGWTLDSVRWTLDSVRYT